MKENKVNDSKEVMDTALSSVAGGSKRDLIVQAVMNADGFKEEWKNHRDPNGVCKWDVEFFMFLNDLYGYERTNAIMDRFESQEEMFSDK